MMDRILMTNWTRRHAELRHGLRIAAAGVLSFALAQALALPQGYWAVFTAVLGVQGSVGGALKASGDRLVGAPLRAGFWGGIAAGVAAAGPPMMGSRAPNSLSPPGVCVRV